jgi:hypothetical protein
MPNVIYEMSVSADGYIVGPDGTFDTTLPRDHRVDMELAETRTFSSRVVYLRYRATGH